MEKRKTAEKAIFFILDILLILGSIISILTIDGGRWLISNPAFYQPPNEISPQIPNTGINSGAANGESVTSQPEGACLVSAKPTQPEWYSSYLLIDGYNSSGVGGNPQPSATQPGGICGK